MGHLLKFNGDSNPVSLIIMVLDSADIGCWLFWLFTYHRSNSNHATSTAAMHSELKRIYLSFSLSLDSCSCKFAVRSPRTTWSLRNEHCCFQYNINTKGGPLSTNAAAQSASKNEWIQAQRAINAKRALSQLSEKVWHGHFLGGLPPRKITQFSYNLNGKYIKRCWHRKPFSI